MPAAKLDSGQQWEAVVGIAAWEIARVRVVVALQARAALKIDAAEHAFSRILADCARILPTPATPEPAHRSEPQTSRSLAA